MAAAATGSAFAGPSILFDARTGQVIESDQPFQRWYPASLTKLMTTYVAFRAVQSGEVTLQSPIRVSKNAAKEPPSKMGYKPGSVLTLDNALKIIMVKSANDVATAIGESLAGSEAAFAARMNAEARRLGMKDSNWVNAHGLHDDNQYTTAHDLAILASALRREFPQHDGYFSIEGLSAGGRTLPSHNTLIGRFEGADGMKTGYTCPSGYNLIGSATRSGRTLMAVVIGSTSVDSRAEAAASMLARGFAVSSPGSETLQTMKPPSGQAAEPVNMREELCTEKGRKAAALKKQQSAKKGAAEDVSEASTVYLTELNRPRKLVPVSLGGATGPVTEAVAAAFAAESGDVPLPTWRPDLPPPPGAEPVALKDQTAANSL